MNLRLREAAAQDVDLLYRWANDPTVRQNAFHTESIPYDNHRMWFAKNLADRDVLMYILCRTEQKQTHTHTSDGLSGTETEIGQIRLSIEGDHALIDYSIDASMRGQGLGSKMILMAEEKLRENRTDVIYCLAQVKYENPASARVFEKCGYDAQEQEHYIEFTKRIRG